MGKWWEVRRDPKGAHSLPKDPQASQKNPKGSPKAPQTAWSLAWLGPWHGLVPGPAWSLARLGPGSGLVPGPGPMVPGPMVRGPGPLSLAHRPWSMVPGPWSLVHSPWYMVHGTGGPSEARVFHQSGPYRSYGCIRTTIRRRISMRIILDRSRVKVKPSWHRKLRKSLKVFHQYF